MAAERGATGHLALVTGASAGIGRAFAERLARDGYDLVLVARRADHLARLAHRLAGEHGVAVDPLVADLSRAGDLRAVEERLTQGPALDLLVNNAGAVWGRPLVDSDPDELEALLSLHTVAVLRLTRAALPAMIARGRGSIITVSTAGIFFPQPDYYCATKTFGEAFMRALWEEVGGTGVRLQALCPGFTRTEIFERAAVSTEDLPESAWMSAEDVVHASLAGLELGELVCLPSVEDAGLLPCIRAHQQSLVDDGVVGTLAQRYATHGGRDSAQGELHREG